LLEVRGLRKRFGGTVALGGVDFDVRGGEIHALAGANGAGKSTLIRILAGVHAPDGGELRWEGSPITIPSVAAAERLGIRVIHQELALAPNLSIAENLFLGREPAWFGMVRRRRLIADARRWVSDLGFAELREVTRPVGSLSTGCQQLVEIARALAGRARLLILDEPTASLTAAEAEALFARLAELRSRGTAIIHISHRLDELERLADRITVLRDGASVGTIVAGPGSPRFHRDDLVQRMVGRAVAEHAERPALPPPERESPPALTVESLSAGKVREVSFRIRRGEVYGLAGIVGAGRTELARALFGIDPIDSGRVLIDGRPVSLQSPAAALAAGIAMVPEDRKGQGIFPNESVGFQLALPWLREWITAGVVPRPTLRRRLVDRLLGEFAIKTRHRDASVGELSGGNQQKGVVARWMHRPPRVLILDEPTRGVDVGARGEMFSIIRRLVEERGLAVLLISSDLPEVTSLCHRLGLMRGGRLVAETDPATTPPEAIMAELTRGETR
jgi:ABC-type sugar transport system ATPase subunit